MAASDLFDLKPNPNPLSDADRAERLKKLAFGKQFTDNMVVIPYAEGKGWGRGELRAYGNIELDPAASTLHYGQAIFEGFKAYAQKDGSIASFRPGANAERFRNSAARLAMPGLPDELFLGSAEVLVSQDRAWVPTNPGESLYLRPLMIATEPALGVKPASTYLFLLLASPAGPYFAKGVKPVTVWIDEEYVRAAPGGTGAAKCAGNYAASLVAQRKAQELGADQVVWIDAVERRFVEEMGGMNLFFVYEDRGKPRLFTPKLSGSILPGVTRRSLLEIAGDLGYESEEGQLSVEQWGEDLASGKMTEVFACGTAAVITPVGTVKSKHGEWQIRGGQAGPISVKLREHLLGIQHGSIEDKHGWMYKLC